MSDIEIKIILTDDHTVMRKGLHTLIDNHSGLTVVGEADNGRML